MSAHICEYCFRAFATKSEFLNHTPKPTREQFEAVEAIANSLHELSEIWDENFSEIFEHFGEAFTGDLLTRSLDEMASAWTGFRYCVGDLTNPNRGE